MSRVISLFNVFSRKKEIFKPIYKKWVGLYTCGPTVYNFAHIGNLRTYIFEDVLHRTLEYGGYRVRHIMNITDVEDKVIREAKASGKSISAFTRPYEKSFFQDLDELNIKRAYKYPRATEHIPEMIDLISKLLKKKLAYKIKDSVYFDISKFKSYGLLSHINKKELKAGLRIDIDEYEKNDIRDFALWKAKKRKEPFWHAPFGAGRPGWHIECSAMSMKYLGPTFDIHTGGVDNIFPHHENEIAQSEGATGKKFANFFIEDEHLLVGGKKMSKSLGNIIILADLKERNINPLAFRYLMLTAHYRTQLNFTYESITAAQNSLNHLYKFVSGIINSDQDLEIKNPKVLDKYKEDFEKSIFDDLDTSKALAIIWKLIGDYNKNPGIYNPKHVLKLLYDFDKVFGLNLKKIKAELIPEDIKKMVETREKYRKEKKWQEADKIRKDVESLGWIIEDAPDGPKIK